MTPPWNSFEAEQVLRWDRGSVWRTSVRQHGVPIVGSDRWLDGEGAMRWRLLGLVPVATGTGPDVSRSAAGRLQIESIWRRRWSGCKRRLRRSFAYRCWWVEPWSRPP